MVLLVALGAQLNIQAAVIRPGPQNALVKAVHLQGEFGGGRVQH